MNDDGARSIRQSIRGADRGLRVIDGGALPAPPASGDGDACPVVALGHLAGVFHFLDVRGQKRELTARQLGSRHDLLSLFGGDETWLLAHHPKRINRNAKDENAAADWVTVDFLVNESAAALQRACFDAGLWGDHVVLRRPGIWAGADGLPVAHCGDAVLIGDGWQPAGARTGAQFWIAAAPTPRPDLPCPVAVTRELRDGLTRLWCWGDEGAPTALLGLIANAYYGAAIAWRPGGFVSGDSGWGKSALRRVVRAAFPVHHYSNDTTKAGIEQAAFGRAMPIVIEEAADRADRAAARNVADLLLSAADDEGTRGTRGTSDGKGRAIEVVGLILMFSINPPDLEPQHIGRLAMIELRAPEEGVVYREEHARLAAFVAQHARALWGRALAGFERYRAALPMFREALRARGCAPRECDHAGALLAGWWVMLHEGVPDARGVREGVAALGGFVRPARVVQSDSRPKRALNHLLTALVHLHRSTDRDAIGRLIEIGWGADAELRSPNDARDLLLNHGIRVVRRCVAAGAVPVAQGCGCINCREPHAPFRPVPRMSPDDGIWLANGHAELRRIFESSQSPGDKWRSELGRLPLARPSGRSIRVGRGTPGHALWLPRAEIEGAEDEPDG